MEWLQMAERGAGVAQPLVGAQQVPRASLQVHHRSQARTSTSPTTFQLAPLSLETSRPAAVVMLCDAQAAQHGMSNTVASSPGLDASPACAAIPETVPRHTILPQHQRQHVPAVLRPRAALAAAAAPAPRSTGGTLCR